jgi:hypothetical protein
MNGTKNNAKDVGKLIERSERDAWLSPELFEFFFDLLTAHLGIPNRRLDRWGAFLGHMADLCSPTSYRCGFGSPTRGPPGLCSRCDGMVGGAGGACCSSACVFIPKSRQRRWRWLAV